MQQNVGPSRLTAVPLGSGDHNDELLRAVRDAAAGSHDVLGEMGRDAGGRVIYLARDLKSAALVALRPSHQNLGISVLRTMRAWVT